VGKGGAQEGGIEWNEWESGIEGEESGRRNESVECACHSSPLSRHGKKEGHVSLNSLSFSLHDSGPMTKYQTRDCAGGLCGGTATTRGHWGFAKLERPSF